MPEATNPDYHRQYDQLGFVDALARTRSRQARRIVALIKRHLPGADSIVDFGSGRGWFLDCARESGFTHLAGLDTSALAIELLRERGIEGVLLEGPMVTTNFAALVSFPAEVVVALDVIEHLRATELKAQVHALIQGFQPRLVVFKVPTSEGLLYRMASRLARVGVLGPLEHLYQLGTHPPHWNYFSRRSLAVLLRQCGLEVLETQADRDFEGADFSRRVHALSRLGKLGRPIGAVAAGVADVFGLQDSIIVVARLNSRGS